MHKTQTVSSQQSFLTSSTREMGLTLTNDHTRHLAISKLGIAILAGFATTAPLLAHAEQETTLPTVTVKSTVEKEEGYRATKTRVGKVEQDPQDIPQAITTITKALIEEQEANSLREALRNVSGLTYNAAEGGRSGDNMMLRGFYTFGDMYLDGIRDTAQYNREVFNLEQVDVLRGAAAMLFGRGQAGGVINQVSKTPSLAGVNKVEAGIGTDGYQEVKGDFNYRLGETSAFRLNVMKRDEDSSRSNPATGTTPQVHREGLAPSLSLGLGTDHELTLSHLYVKTSDRADYGIPFSGGKPNTSFAESGAYWGTEGTFDDSETNISTLNYLYKISPEMQWRNVIRSSNYRRAYWAGAPGNDTNFASGGSAKTREFETDNFVYQSDLSRNFLLGDMEHELLAGFEYLRESSSRWSLANLGTSANPVYKAGYFNGAPSTYNGDTISYYVQDTVEFIPDWKLTLGVRRDEMKADYVTVSGTTTSSFSGNFSENSYRTGLSWQPSFNQHYYLGWSDSFSPTADLYQLAGSDYPAERSQVIELGAKWLLFNGDLSFRTSIYHANKDWERNTDLESSATILTKKRESNGIEFELAGRINDKWDVFGGLSLIDAEILEVAPGADSSYQGKYPRNTAKLTSNLWTTYKLGGGWKVGGGMEYKSKRYGYTPTRGIYSPNVIPSYTRWDAMLAYEQPKYTVKLNVQNIFDKLYYDSLYDNGGFTVPGQSRRLILSTEFKF